VPPYCGLPAVVVGVVIFVVGVVAVVVGFVVGVGVVGIVVGVVFVPQDASNKDRAIRQDKINHKILCFIFPPSLVLTQMM
jgi:membrane-bound ClpP family serine protease